MRVASLIVSLPLRLDQLGLVLQHAGLRTGSRVVLYEQALGVAVAATLERLAGDGACVYLHRGKVPQSIPCYHAMEFDDKVLSRHCSWTKLLFQYKDTFLPLRITSLLLESVATDAAGGDQEAKDDVTMDAAEDEIVEKEEEVSTIIPNHVTKHRCSGDCSGRWRRMEGQAGREGTQGVELTAEQCD